MNETFFDVDRGNRLKVERQRLGFTQKRVCELAGTHVPTWVRYEKGQAFNVDFSDVLQKLGFDMVFVIFNQRMRPMNLDDSEQMLLRIFRSVSLDQRSAFLKMAQVFAQCNPAEAGDQ